MIGDTTIAAVRKRPMLSAAWPIATALVAFLLFLTTAQWHINGSQSPYATDVGEIQNALPRWGTIHFTGYPLYTFLGSFWVTLLRLAGVEPAAGASVFSSLWGAVAVGLLTAVAQELGIAGLVAALSSLMVSLAKSVWTDASLAEVHTLTLAFTALILLLSLRYARSGQRKDLLWLALAFSQGIAHQRAVAFLAPAMIVLLWPRLGAALRDLPRVLGVSLLAPVTYLYLPLREWMGADWTFGQTATWTGFWAMFADTKSNRIVHLPSSLTELWSRAGIVAGLLGDELPWAVLLLGAVGIVLIASRRSLRLGLGLLLVALPYRALSYLIWEGDVSDALLAVTLPALLVAGLGLGFALHTASARARWARATATVLLLLLCVALFADHRSAVLAITRDPSAEGVIRTAEGVEPLPDRESTMVVLWGHDYWALAYAQAYLGRLPDIQLADHNVDLSQVQVRAERLLTLDRTFYHRPLAWWEERLGRVYLRYAAPGVVELSTAPALLAARPSARRSGRVQSGTASTRRPAPFTRERPSRMTRPSSWWGLPESPAFTWGAMNLGNGIEIASAWLRWQGERTLRLTVYWHAVQQVTTDYAVAVHLVSNDPPTGPQDILAQADRQHPVGGWYPTSRWQEDEVVRDIYVIPVPPEATPVAVRLGMYHVDGEGRFQNTEWLSLEIPKPA